MKKLSIKLSVVGLVSDSGKLAVCYFVHTNARLFLFVFVAGFGPELDKLLTV